MAAVIEQKKTASQLKNGSQHFSQNIVHTLYLVSVMSPMFFPRPSITEIILNIVDEMLFHE